MRANSVKQFETLSKNIKHAMLNEDSEPDLDLLANKLKSYVQILAEADRANCQEVYDYFCETNGLQLLRRLLRHDRQLVVRTVSLMLINLHNELWISFILSHPLITELIALPVDDSDEELTEHYISFLKSLSIRLDAKQINLFYNKKFCTFPLVFQALRYYNHSDNMVRTSVMNLTLGIMKIKHERVTRYFQTFPFTLYFIHFCCSLTDQWTRLQHILDNFEQSQRHRLKMDISDQNDALYYLYDMYQYGSARVSSNLLSCLLSYCVLPVLARSLLAPTSVKPKLALYLLLLMLRIFKDKLLCCLIACLLFGKRIHKQLLACVNRPVEMPQSYSFEYQKGSHHFWDKFEFEITEHCQGLFKDVLKFETDHEERKRNGAVSQTAADFQHEIERLDAFVGFGLLNGKQGRNWEAMTKAGDPALLQANPIRQEVLRLLREGDDGTAWLISNLIIATQRNPDIPNQTLKFCGLLMPRLDTVNYLDEFNIESILLIRSAALEQLQKSYRISTLRNMVLLIDELSFREFEPEQLKIMLGVYEKAIIELKTAIKPENLSVLVRSFEEEHRRWATHAYIPELPIPYLVFIEGEVKDDQQLLYTAPCSPKEKVRHSIIVFTIMRSLFTKYQENLHRLPEHSDKQHFDEAYSAKFGQTTVKWKVGKVYQFENRYMTECSLRPPDKKLKPTPVLLMEDAYNFILVEPSSENNEGTVLLNVRYKGVEIEVPKQDNRALLVRWTSELQHGEHTLQFGNELQCVGAVDRVRQCTRQAFEEEQAFILKYVQHCHKEMKQLEPV